jgi:hypothetical protein
MNVAKKPLEIVSFLLAHRNAQTIKELSLHAQIANGLEGVCGQQEDETRP